MKKVLLSLIIILLILPLSFYLQFQPAEEPRWGINFSILQAGYLSAYWPEMYLAILDELKPQRLRLMAYWPLLEPKAGEFNFASVDYLLQEAGRRGIEVILVVGQKQPRWPECHEPDWAQNLESRIQNIEVLEYIEAVAQRYKDDRAVVAWQVENEPFFPFGPECFAIPRDLYLQEVELVKNLDPSRSVIATDSGEKGDWLRTAWTGADIFGSTMYRTVYHHQKQKYITYLIPPVLYRIKAGMIKTLSSVDQVIGVELQAEPWFATDVFATPLDEQLRLMNPEIFWQNINYARRVGFAENYLWGAEWWYWMRKQGHPEMWEAAKALLSGN